MLGPDREAGMREVERRAGLSNRATMQALETLAENVRKHGGHVYFAADAEDAADYCLNIARRNGAKLAVKGKSMVSEEMGLNEFLESRGIEAAETDLGEFIIQLNGETPAHIIVPAIHKNKDQISKIFHEKIPASAAMNPCRPFRCR
mgnify:CR=1 FL=1